MKDIIFVFGSNLQGRHGKGAALHAKQHHGAIYGQGNGPQGRSYAIPTKVTPYQQMPLSSIEAYVKEFIDYASNHPELTFQVTTIGCGLAGHKPKDIKPMFHNAPTNCILPPEFRT